MCRLEKDRAIEQEDWRRKQEDQKKKIAQTERSYQ